MAEEAKTKIIEFNRQLDLPLVWWSESKVWEDRYLPSTVDRPTEDMALENIYNHACLKQGRLKIRLDPLEYRVYKTELQSYRKCPRYFNQDERQSWVAKQLGLGVQMVKDILRSVDVYTFHQTLIEEFERVEMLAADIPMSRKGYSKLVQEVMHEEKAAA